MYPAQAKLFVLQQRKSGLYRSHRFCIFIGSWSGKIKVNNHSFCPWRQCFVYNISLQRWGNKRLQGSYMISLWREQNTSDILIQFSYFFIFPFYIISRTKVCMRMDILWQVYDLWIFVQLISKIQLFSQVQIKQVCFSVLIII